MEHTVPVDERLDQLGAIQHVVVIIVVHLEVMKLKLFLGQLVHILIAKCFVKMFLKGYPNRRLDQRLAITPLRWSSSSPPQHEP